MEKIRIEPKNRYVIEVNDAGETISFDPDDIDLIFRLEHAYQRANEIRSALKADIFLIDKQADAPEPGQLLTRNQKARAEAYRKAFRDMRAVFDEILGEGACNKIFGDRNYLTMFDDLLEQLTPHFEAMKLNAEHLYDKIAKKHSVKPDDGDVLR